MNQLLTRLRQLYGKDGLSGVFAKTVAVIYRTKIRQYVPKTERIVEYNGVKTPVDIAVLDRFVPGYELPWYVDDIPGYENGEVESVRRYCTPGEDVLIIIGGFGVTAVVAAEAIGPEGSVTVYEASDYGYQRTTRTIRYHDIEDRVKVHHAIVAEAISLRGEAGEAEIVQPSDLPDADVYEIDCEGAELAILRNLKPRPRVILVETHGQYDSPVDDVIGQLKQMDCCIEDVYDKDSSHIHDVISTQTK